MVELVMLLRCLLTEKLKYIKPIGHDGKEVQLDLSLVKIPSSNVPEWVLMMDLMV